MCFGFTYSLLELSVHCFVAFGHKPSHSDSQFGDARVFVNHNYFGGVQVPFSRISLYTAARFLQTQHFGSESLSSELCSCFVGHCSALCAFRTELCAFDSFGSDGTLHFAFAPSLGTQKQPSLSFQLHRDERIGRIQMLRSDTFGSNIVKRKHFLSDSVGCDPLSVGSDRLLRLPCFALAFPEEAVGNSEGGKQNVFGSSEQFGQNRCPTENSVHQKRFLQRRCFSEAQSFVRLEVLPQRGTETERFWGFAKHQTVGSERAQRKGFRLWLSELETKRLSVFPKQERRFCVHSMWRESRKWWGLFSKWFARWRSGSWNSRKETETENNRIGSSEWEQLHRIQSKSIDFRNEAHENRRRFRGRVRKNMNEVQHFQFWQWRSQIFQFKLLWDFVGLCVTDFIDSAKLLIFFPFLLTSTRYLIWNVRRWNFYFNLYTSFINEVYLFLSLFLILYFVHKSIWYNVKNEVIV